MNEYIIDILFLLSIVLLYFLPRKSEKYKFICIISLIVFLLNLGIRGHLIYQKHKLSARIVDLGKRVNVINSIEIYVNLDERTENKEITEKETSDGVQNVVALFTSNNERFRFITDFKFSYQQIAPDIRRATFIYKPEKPEEILGRNINFLEKMNTFGFNYTNFIDKVGFSKTNKEHRISITVLLNGIQVVALENIGISAGIHTGQLVLDVSEAFENISETYQQQIEKTI